MLSRGRKSRRRVPTQALGTLNFSTPHTEINNKYMSSINNWCFLFLQTPIHNVTKSIGSGSLRPKTIYTKNPHIPKKGKKKIKNVTFITSCLSLLPNVRSGGRAERLPNVRSGGRAEQSRAAKACLSTRDRGVYARPTVSSHIVTVM